jgi:hypothetical protein
VPFEFDAECAPLPTLKRLEWWVNSEAERSGGINSLVQVLSAAPNVQHLFIGNFERDFRGVDRRPVHLPQLQVLHFRTVSAMPMYQVATYWDLPALSHLILDMPPSMSAHCVRPFFETHGSKIRSVELGRSLRFFMTDMISQCLQGCPHLQQLNYYAFFTAAPRATEDDTPLHENLISVGLHLAKNDMLDDENQMWDFMEQHFDLFISGAFPSLQRVILYGDLHFGDWDNIACHTRFAPLEQGLQARGIELIV